MNIVTIKEVKSVVQCADDGTTEHVFNVKNTTASALQVGMQISTSEPTETEWLSIDGPAEHELEVETMTQITVKIQVSPDCAAGKYSYRLRVFDPQNPGERFTDGETVYFEVPEKVPKPAPKPPKKKIKWWIPAAIAAGVILVAGILFLILNSGPEVATFDKSQFDKAAFK